MPVSPHTAINALNLVLLPQGTLVVYASAGATHGIRTIIALTAFTYRADKVCANSPA